MHSVFKQKKHGFFDKNSKLLDDLSLFILNVVLFSTLFRQIGFSRYLSKHWGKFSIYQNSVKNLKVPKHAKNFKYRIFFQFLGISFFCWPSFFRVQHFSLGEIFYQKMSSCVLQIEGIQESSISAELPSCCSSFFYEKTRLNSFTSLRS